ncbi:hypothetical protein PSEUBRA_005468 [Kalmanozyma brasiliensis GHG001]|uniref:THUMP domain-containing protein n=1 Tax=Kalmanozyma brasiliensis (strain GHG001) TaxID=1365824 RepID=V5ET90_KALBG|nr:uncharacterized protein PSEUBRA_005468 [Kalmanozyma brasiliensis GHG001]EST05204.1 hypothetical protein PSEUBRA_005468 [Kalmanozyma brasiliensis GHG001]
MPSKRKRSGPGFNRDTDSGPKRSKPYHQVYRVAAKNISGPGIFVTCVQSKERKAALQFIDLLNEVADRLYPGVVPQPQPQEGEAKKDVGMTEEEDMDALRNGAIAEASVPPPATETETIEAAEGSTTKQAEAKKSDEDDIAAQIAAELSDIKSSERSRGPSNKKAAAPRFKNVETDTECFLFISVSPPFDPYLLVYTILSDVELSGEPRSRFVQRLTPVIATCAANQTDLTTLARTILPSYFSTNPDEGKTFKIDPRIRSHSKLKRGDVIQVIASNIPTAEPEVEGGERRRVHNANLTNPDYWIVVEVVKNSAAISVVKDYERFKKMNLQMVAQAANEKRAVEGGEVGAGEGRIAASLAKTEKTTAKETAQVAQVTEGEEKTAQVAQATEGEKDEEAAAAQTQAQAEEAPASKENGEEQQMANFRLF